MKTLALILLATLTCTALAANLPAEDTVKQLRPLLVANRRPAGKDEYVYFKGHVQTFWRERTSLSCKA